MSLSNVFLGCRWVFFRWWSCGVWSSSSVLCTRVDLRSRLGSTEGRYVAPDITSRHAQEKSPFRLCVSLSSFSSYPILVKRSAFWIQAFCRSKTDHFFPPGSRTRSRPVTELPRHLVGLHASLRCAAHRHPPRYRTRGGRTTSLLDNATHGIPGTCPYAVHYVIRSMAGR